MGVKNKTPIDVVKLFLKLQSLDEESGDVITNLKAQKLLYYAQGVSLAKTGKPLFNDDFVAWQHGPVIPKTYSELKDFGRNQIIFKDEVDVSLFEEEELNILVSVYKTFGQYSAWKLRDMTHSESPWRDVEINEIITKESIRSYFSERYARI